MNENYKVKIDGDQMVITQTCESPKVLSFCVQALFDLADNGGSDSLPKAVTELLFEDARLSKTIYEHPKKSEKLEIEGIPVTHDTICDAHMLTELLENLELDLSFPEKDLEEIGAELAEV